MSRVARLVRQTVEKRGEYLKELHAARAVIEALPEMQEAHATCGERRARAIVWAGSLPTLRAWNIASSGNALAILGGKWRHRLGDLTGSNGMFKGDRMTRVPCDPPHGVDLLSQRDVFSIRPVPRRIRAPEGTALRASSNMILMASRGQLNEGALFGKVERAVHMPGEAIVSEDVMRLNVDPRLTAGLFSFLSTTVGLSLLRSTAYGTSIPGMRIDLLSNLPVPDDEILAKAIAPIDRASRARIAASTAEAEAIRIIEEEVLPSWLA